MTLKQAEHLVNKIEELVEGLMTYKETKTLQDAFIVKEIKNELISLFQKVSIK